MMHTRGGRHRIVLLLVVLLVGGNTLRAVDVLAQQTTLTGTFTMLFFDPPPGSGGTGGVRYRVTDDTGKTVPLQIAPAVLQAAGGGMALDRRRVTVVGTPGPTTRANATPTFAVQTIAAETRITGLPHRDILGAQSFVSVLCKFNDVTAEPRPVAYFDTLMGTGPGSLGEYFSQASYGNISLGGATTTVGWFVLPQPRSAYVPPNGAANLDLLAKDCAALIPPTLAMTGFVGLNFMFNDVLDGSAWGGTGETLTINGVLKDWPSTWMPPWGYYPDPGNVGGQTVIAHEMGHAFGLLHSAGPTGVTYKNSWDVMSDDYSYCANPGATDPTVGCLGQHMIAWDKDFEGWIPAAKKFIYAGTGQTITFGALSDPATPNVYLAVIPHPGTTTQFTTVEFRRLLGYDQKLAGNAVIIHELDTTRENPAWVVGTDGLAGAMFTAGMSYTAPNSGGVKVTVNTVDATSASVTFGVVTGPPPPTSQPPTRPGAPTNGTPGTLPGARAGSNTGGSPNPLPPRRP
jgi:M6 family metalloprotease-like protein